MVQWNIKQKKKNYSNTEQVVKILFNYNFFHTQARLFILMLHFNIAFIFRQYYNLMGSTYSCCVTQELKNKDHLLIMVNKYRREVWYLPVYDAIKQCQVDQLMETCPNFYHQVAHYEQGEVNFDDSDHFFNKFESMNTDEKEIELDNLISRCYVVLDQEELPLNANKQLTPNSAERHLFTESIVYDVSILEQSSGQSDDIRKHRMSRLREFDPQILKKLSNFASFCQEIRSQFSEPFSLFSRMFINFKAQMLTSFESQLSIKSNINNLGFKDKFRACILKFVSLMVECMTFIYKLDKTLTDEGDYTFFTNTNLFTLVTSVLFQDSDFNSTVVKIYKIAFINVVQKFKTRVNKSVLMQNGRNREESVMKVLMKERGQSESTKYSRKDSEEEEFLFSSIRMLDRLTTVPQPILKLKVFHEASIRAIKSIQKLKQKTDRETADIIGADQVSKTILSLVQRVLNENFVIYTLITNDFIHQDYRIGKLGCSLAPFLISIEKLSI